MAGDLALAAAELPDGCGESVCERRGDALAEEAEGEGINVLPSWRVANPCGLA